jgi:hypothetical protein
VTSANNLVVVQGIARILNQPLPFWHLLNRETVLGLGAGGLLPVAFRHQDKLQPCDVQLSLAMSDSLVLQRIDRAAA